MPTTNQTTSADDVKSSRPNQPVPSFLQEAENLYVWCAEDIPELLKGGITGEQINELPEHIKACREAQIRLEIKMKTPGEAQVQWKLQLPEAIKLKAELLQSMRFAFRNHPDLSDRLKYISKGENYAGLIQELNNLAVFGSANSELLTAIGFNLGLLDTATAKSEEMATLWAQSKSDKAHMHDVAVLRNKAFWTLHKQVAEIRATGQFVFRDRPDRYVGYLSQFWKQKDKRKSNSSN